MATRRQERVSGRIVQEVSSIVRSLKDTRIGFVTFTRTEVSPDLRHAKVFFTVFGEEQEREDTLNALNRASGHIRGSLGKNLGMKFTPRLEFVYDRNVCYADDMERLISEARSTDPNPGVSESEESGEEE